jgi:tRNA(adenine34) deaminase
LWDTLSLPWQVSFELAWEAYCDDCYPIGAVVTDAGGNILTRGRNRIYEKKPRIGQLPGDELAHAEVEALQAFQFGSVDPHTCVLYTTTEPCPMCMGTFYMSGVRTLHFAARDPYAGSANLLGTTWYLSRKPIRVSGPVSLLEPVVMALFAEQEARFHNQVLPAGLFWDMCREAIPNGVELGLQLARTGMLLEFKKQGTPAKEVLETLLSQVK